eukprot:11143259-Alexandrium_andersonii.AAC.1
MSAVTALSPRRARRAAICLTAAGWSLVPSHSCSNSTRTKPCEQPGGSGRRQGADQRVVDL